MTGDAEPRRYVQRRPPTGGGLAARAMDADSRSLGRRPRTRTSRWVDRVSDALGHEAAFAAATGGAAAWLIIGMWVGLHLVVVTSVITLITFMMVFALQQHVRRT